MVQTSQVSSKIIISLSLTFIVNPIFILNAIHNKGSHPPYRTDAVLDSFQLTNFSTYFDYEHRKIEEDRLM